MAKSKSKIFSDSDFEKAPANVKPVVIPKQEESNANVQPETPPTKKSKNWIWLVLALIAAVVIFLCYKSCDKPPVAGTTGDQPTTTQVEDGNDSVAGEENEPVAEASNENDDNADVATEPESKEDEKEDAAAKDSATEPQATAAPNKPAQQNVASPVSITGTLEEKAKAVIRGNYGNGLERKQKLGAEYAEIQGKVNEMYRNGLVR